MGADTIHPTKTPLVRTTLRNRLLPLLMLKRANVKPKQKPSKARSKADPKKLQTTARQDHSQYPKAGESPVNQYNNHHAIKIRIE